MAETFGWFLDSRGLPCLWGLGVEVLRASAAVAGVKFATATGYVAEAWFLKPAKTMKGPWA